MDGQKFIISISVLRKAISNKLSRWSRFHVQSVAPTKLHWARVLDYGPFSLCVIRKEGLYIVGTFIGHLFQETQRFQRFVSFN
jgi:hypothetical protein